MNSAIQHDRFSKLNLLLYLFIIIIFWLTTPFQFDQPIKVRDGTVMGNLSVVEKLQGGKTSRQIALVCLGVFAVASLVRPNRNRLRINGALGWFVTLYALWILYSIVWAPDKVFTAKRIITFVIMLISCVAIAERSRLLELYCLVFFLTFVAVTLGLGNEIRLGTFNPPDPYWRLSGMVHAIHLGWLAGLLSLSSMAMMDLASPKYKKILWCVVFYGLLVLFWTKSRMALAACVIGIMTFYYLRTSLHNKAITFSYVVALLCLLVLYYGSDISNMLISVFTLGRAEGTKETVGSLSGRTFLWSACLEFAADKPLVGYGFNSLLGPANIEAIADIAGWPANSTHSAFVDSIVGLGYIGFTMLVSIFILSLKKGFRLARINSNYTFFASVMAWWFFNSFLETDLVTRANIPSFIAWLVVARMAFVDNRKTI